jgi:hypothetical protein
MLPFVMFLSLSWIVLAVPQVKVIKSLKGFQGISLKDDQLDSQCKDYEDFGYSCVPYYQCDINTNTINTDGKDVIGPRSNQESELIHDEAISSKCGRRLEVCCQLPPHKPNFKKVKLDSIYNKICSYFKLGCIKPTSSPKDPTKNPTVIKTRVNEDNDKKCSSYEEFGFFCVPYYQCDNDTNEIIIDGTALIGPRKKEKQPDHEIAVKSICLNYLEVCCQHPSRTSPIPSDETSSRPIMSRADE